MIKVAPFFNALKIWLNNLQVVLFDINTVEYYLGVCPRIKIENAIIHHRLVRTQSKIEITIIRTDFINKIFLERLPPYTLHIL